MTQNGQWTQPAWKPPTGSKQYQPSHNIGPTCYLPVMLSKTHFPENLNKSPTDVETAECSQDLDQSELYNSCDWIIRPMRWGLVPSWHTGDPSKVGYNMINARSDTILNKITFSTPLQKGRRCVVLAEGYFEWHCGKDGKKQPYFIYTSCGDQKNADQVEGMNVSEPIKYSQDLKTVSIKQGKENLKDEDDTPKCRKRGHLVKMAGLFDVSSQGESEGDPLYSFAVITVDAHKKLSSIHHRMPAILNGETELREWLDFGSVPLKKAVCLLRPVDCVDFYPVSTIVNSVRNDTSECVKPIVLGKPKETGSSKLMSSWLSKGTSSVLAVSIT